MRSNADWLAELRQAGASGDASRRELREFLVVSLARALSIKGVSRDHCEDFAQDALLRISAKLDDFRGDSAFTTWALAIAMRIAFDELRRKRWKDVSLDDLTSPPTPAASRTPRYDQDLARERVLATLREVIDRELTDKQRAMILAELGGMPQAEIAARMNMTRNAVYKLGHDVRRKLKQRLEDKGITQDDARWIFA